MNSSFSSFKMPDFKSRPDGESKPLKDAYIFLRRQNFPDKDIFIYPLGEYNKFQGEIMGQSPDPGDIVSPDDRVILLVNMPGICDLMPDLYTDHSEDFFAEDFDERTGARRLFSIFDSFFLKMQCRLDWIRDIYAGLYLSENFVDYLSSLFSFPEHEMNILSPEILGYVLPKLYKFLGTEGAMKVYIKAVLGFESEVSFSSLQSIDMPENTFSKLAGRSRLGESMHLGKSGKIPNPELNITIYINDYQSLKEIVPGGNKHQLLKNIIRLCLPYYSEEYNINIKPGSEEISFISGDTYLGYSTIIKSEN